MKIIVVGHGMVGHKFLEELHQLQLPQVEVTVLCEEPRAAYDRVGHDGRCRNRGVQLRGGGRLIIAQRMGGGQHGIGQGHHPCPQHRLGAPAKPVPDRTKTRCPPEARPFRRANRPPE